MHVVLTGFSIDWLGSWDVVATGEQYRPDPQSLFHFSPCFHFTSATLTMKCVRWGFLRLLFIFTEKEQRAYFFNVVINRRCVVSLFEDSHWSPVVQAEQYLNPSDEFAVLVVLRVRELVDLYLMLLDLLHDLRGGRGLVWKRRHIGLSQG